MQMTDSPLPVVTIGLILLTAAVTAIFSRRLKLPYSVGLVAAGIALSLLPIGPQLRLSRELIFTVLLPPLIFEAALQLKWSSFARELPVTLLLAFLGVLIAAALVAVGVRFGLGWSWIGAGLFGVLIAATDPVSVVAAFRELKVQPRLAMLVESESLLNDGVAAVGFAVLAGVASGVPASPIHIFQQLLWIVAGGMAAGAGVAFLALLIAGRTQDHLVEITLTTISAYGSFLIAERVGASGVVASLTAGLIVGNVGLGRTLSEASRQHVTAFWDYAAFLANSAVFILIGVQEAHQPLVGFWGGAAFAILLVLLGRAAAVYPLSALVIKTPLRIDLGYQHVLFWGGLRGALGLALALALPLSLKERPQIIVAAFAVVAFSIFVQGLTMPWLIRRLGLARVE